MNEEIEDILNIIKWQNLSLEKLLEFTIKFGKLIENLEINYKIKNTLEVKMNSTTIKDVIEVLYSKIVNNLN